MVISVITVCYNADKTLSDTIKSVLIQDYPNIEYIIIDGASTDNTLEIVKSYQDEFNAKGYTYKWISEKDQGIYDAMNKGIHSATGEWILFMNADDSFCRKDALSLLMLKNPCNSADVIYGNEYVYNGRGSIFLNKRNSDMTLIKKTLPFCHQSSLTRAELYKKYEYDTQYKIVADYDFFLKLYYQDAKFQYVNVDVAKYDSTGTSYSKALLALDESYTVKAKFGIINPQSYAFKIKYIYWKTRIKLKLLMRW